MAIAMTRLGTQLSRYGTWLACCLSRGPKAPLTKGDVEDLAAEMGEDSYAGGTLVFRRGDPAARVHVVRSGTIELSRTMNGRRVMLQLLHPGDVFGDVPALLGDVEPFDARAVNDAIVLSIESGALMELLQSRPHIAHRWFVSLAERMAGLQSRLVDLLAGGLESQVASILLREANGDDVRLTHGQLGEMLGTPRASVQRVLKSLEAAGLIKLHYRRIELADQTGLLSLVVEEEE